MFVLNLWFYFSNSKHFPNYIFTPTITPKHGHIWRVGDGRSIRIWRDNWIPRPFSFKSITVQGTCRIRFVAGLLNPNGSWNMALLQQYFLPTDVVEILKIRASPRQEEDIIAWGPGKHGSFSVKSDYNRLRRLTDLQNRPPVGHLMAEGKCGS